METITSEAQWFEKLTSISQEFELESVNENYADLDSPGINDDDENEVDVEAQPSREDRLKRQMSPLFASQPKFETICNQENNCLLRSNFTKYFSHMPILDASIDALQNQEDNLKYVLHLCRYTLKELYLIDYPLSKILKIIDTTIPTLKKLNLTYFKEISEECEHVFSNMPRLQELKIEWYCENSTLPIIFVKFIEQVGGTLKRLYISKSIGEYHPFSPDSLVPVFPRLTVLEELAMWGLAHLNQALIESIAEIKSLVTLKLITHLKEVIQCNMYPIGNLKNLKKLDIRTDFGVTDEFLINLSNNAKNLTELTIVGTNITDNGIMALNNLTELEDFDLGLYKLQKKNTLITDESFRYLFLKKLKCMDISNCIRITNHSVITIVKNCTNLFELTIMNTSVTAKVAKELTYLTKYRRGFLYLRVSFSNRHYTFESFESDKVFIRTQSNNLSIDTY